MRKIARFFSSKCGKQTGTCIIAIKPTLVGYENPPFSVSDEGLMYNAKPYEKQKEPPGS